jgi:hypothetical protein
MFRRLIDFGLRRPSGTIFAFTKKHRWTKAHRLSPSFRVANLRILLLAGFRATACLESDGISAVFFQAFSVFIRQ